MSTRTVGQLEQAGVHVAWFRPMRFGSLRRANQRNHRKILIVDSTIGFTGGVGIADQWNGNADGPGQWRETHCCIEGPACADLAAGFASNWAEAAHERLPQLDPAPAAGSTAIMTTLSSAGARPTPMEQLFETAINASEKRLWITSAYFIPSPVQVQAMCAAAARGVDVRVLTNGLLTNHKITLFAGRSTYAQLIEGGVKIYEYQRTVLHCKLITLDKQWVTIGSANLDYRSLLINEELNISVVDEALVAKLDLQFLLDLKHARHFGTAAWHRRRWPQRLLEASSSAFSKQL
jgi:cardiolipin synthase